MKNNEQIAKRATSLAAWFLTMSGLLLMVTSIFIFASPMYGPLIGFGMFAAGAIILGLGSLRSGQLDVIYEMRLVRAAISDATSNHPAETDGSASKQMD